MFSTIPKTEKIQTMKNYLHTKAKLKEMGVESYAFEAKLILEYAKDNAELIENILNRRAKKEPLQYIFGSWEFYGDEYILNADCLIPRPETEFLVEYIINNAPKNAKILDLCCGSGCIAISALKRRWDLTATAVDISPGAVGTAKANSKINGVWDNISFFCFDILNDCREINKLIGDVDLIVSNPPYLTQSETEQIKIDKAELSYEPEAAFLGGKDGLDFYRFIIENYSRNCKPNAVTAFEVGINQYKSVVSMFEKINFSCDVIFDYQKIERVVIGTPCIGDIN